MPPGVTIVRNLPVFGYHDRERQALAYWHILGLWKVAIIVEGVVRRVMNNPSNQAISGAPPQEMVEWIVNQAAITAREYGF